MTNLSTDSNEALLAEFHRRLAAGTIEFRDIYSPHQSDYHGLWHGILDEIRDLSNEAFDDPIVKRISERAHALIDEQVRARPVFGVNTTFYGKATAFQDHSPKAA